MQPSGAARVLRVITYEALQVNIFVEELQYMEEGRQLPKGVSINNEPMPNAPPSCKCVAISIKIHALALGPGCTG